MKQASTNTVKWPRNAAGANAPTSQNSSAPAPKVIARLPAEAGSDAPPWPCEDFFAGTATAAAAAGFAGAAGSFGGGAGQVSRVVSVEIAVKKAGPEAEGSVLASDAFFPFPDGVEAAAKAGVTAVVQPGVTNLDDEVVAAANAAGIAMLYTGARHFRH